MSVVYRNHNVMNILVKSEFMMEGNAVSLFSLQKRWIFLVWCRRGISWLDIVNSSYMVFWSSERLQTFSSTTIRCLCVCVYRIGLWLCMCLWACCDFMLVSLVLQGVWWHHQRNSQQIQDNQLSGKCQNCVFVSAAGLWRTSKCVVMMIEIKNTWVCVCVCSSSLGWIRTVVMRSWQRSEF